MASALDNILISSIEFSISFFKNAGPDFRVLLSVTFSKDILIVLINGKIVVHNHIHFFSKFVEPNHVRSFFIFPLLYSFLALNPKGRLDPLASQDPNGTNKVTIAYFALTGIIHVDLIMGELFLEGGPLPLVDKGS